MANPVTVEQIAPYLTERGRIEVMFAEQSFKVAVLTAELEMVRAESDDT